MVFCMFFITNVYICNYLFTNTNRMKRKFGIILYIIILILTANTSSGQEPFTRTIGLKEGLSQASAIAIWKDPMGRMWFGNNAVNCFDGQSTRIYRLSKYFSDVEDVNIHDFCGTDSMLFLLAEKKLVSIHLFNETVTKEADSLRSIFIDKSDLYVTNGKTIVRKNLSNHADKEIFDIRTTKYATTTIWKIVRLNDHTICGLIDNGLLLINTSTGKVYNYLLENENLLNFYVSRNGWIWFGDMDGRIGVVDVSGKITYLPGVNSWLRSFSESDNTVWLGTINGLYRVKYKPSNSVFSLESITPDLSNKHVSSLLVDDQKNLWIGLYYGDVQCQNIDDHGLFFYWADDQISDKLHGFVFGSIVEDADRNLYVATKGSGINYINIKNKKITHFTTETAGLPNDYIRRIYLDENQKRLYISTYYGTLSYLDTNNNTIHLLKDIDKQLPDQAVVEYFFDYNDELLLVTKVDGCFILDKQTNKITPLLKNTQEQKQTTGNVRTAYLDDKSRLWISSLERGFFCVSLDKRTILHQYGDGISDHSEIKGVVNAICGNSRSGLFMTTNNQGILSYNEASNSFTQHTADNNLLLSNNCCNIAMTSSGNLIVTSDLGLTVIDVSMKKELRTSFHLHLLDLERIQGFSSDCDLYISSKTQNIYVGALGGMIVFNEHLIGDSRNDYNLMFSSLLLNNKLITTENPILPKTSLAFAERIVLPYDHNLLQFSFTTTNYKSTNYSQYEYMLDGWDESWVKTHKREINYSGLRAGNYTLYVREQNNPDKMISLPIHVESPFWLSTWAIIFYIIAGGLISFFFIRMQRSKSALRLQLEIDKNEKQFVTHLSNELRTPLTTLTGMLESVAMDNTMSGRGRINKAIKQIGHIQSLIGQLLEYTTNKTTSPMPKLENLNLEQEQTDQNPEEQHNSSTSQSVLLIVDSDSDFRLSLKNRFSFDYRILEASTANQAEELLNTNTVDIIVCEQYLPDLSGAAFCKQIKSDKQTALTPFILLTDNPSVELHIQSIRAGSDEYLVKPFPFELLLYRCKVLIQNKSKLQQAVAERTHKDSLIVAQTKLITTNLKNKYFMEKAIASLDKNIGNNNFDIQIWSQEMGVGRTTLFNQIKEITSMTPNDFILNYKMEQAKKWLLENYDDSIADIAYKLGYSDPAYFSRIFKKIVGESPQQYRKSNS